MGWIVVDDDGAFEMLSANLLPPSTPIAITDELFSQQRTGRYARAGSPSGGHYTPSQGVSERMRAAIGENPGLYLKDLIRLLESEGICGEAVARQRLLGKNIISGIHRKGIGTNARFWVEDAAP